MENFVSPSGARPQRNANGSSPRPPAGIARYADVATLAGVGVALVAMLFGVLEYQTKVFGGMVKAEVAPLTVAMAEMEKRMTVRFDGVEKRMDRLEQRIDRLDQRVDGLDQRVIGLAQQIGDLSTRVGRLEGRAGK